MIVPFPTPGSSACEQRTLRLSAEGHTGIFPEGRWLDPDGRLLDLDTAEALVAALPQIVAVVEAATHVHAIYATSGQCEETTQKSLRAALKALEEALS